MHQMGHRHIGRFVSHYFRLGSTLGPITPSVVEKRLKLRFGWMLLHLFAFVLKSMDIDHLIYTVRTNDLLNI